MDIFDKKNQKAGAFDFTESVYREEDVEIYKKYFSPESMMIKDKKTKEMRPKTDKEIKDYYLNKTEHLRCLTIFHRG